MISSDIWPTLCLNNTKSIIAKKYKSHIRLLQEVIFPEYFERYSWNLKYGSSRVSLNGK